MDGAEIKEIVKEKYGLAALRGKSGSCCGTADASGTSCDPITSNLYDATQMQQVPDEAMLASLGCGNPTALAKLNPGEIVLDLGSGGGIDVLLSAKRVGPTGKAYGLDMTDEMLALAEENNGPISGAHFNPAVTLTDAWQHGIEWRHVPAYIVAQIVGAFAGVASAHLMFGEPIFAASRHVRSGGAQIFSEFVATFGLLAVIWGCVRFRS